jgi:hypothetical protein
MQMRPNTGSSLRTRWQLLIAAACAATALSAGCGASRDTVQEGTELSAVDSGATLWAQNCNRCHHYRPPDSLAPDQWDVAVMHMRVRANLTEADARAILKFLQSGQ